MSKRIKITNSQDAKTLSNLVAGLSLEGLQAEIYSLRKYLEFNTKEFKAFLEDAAKKIDYSVDRGKSILISKEGDYLSLPKKIEDSFKRIMSNPEHWLFHLVKFTPKEILILLYFEKL